MFRDPVEHARRRKPWNRAFNSAALKDYQPKIAHRASQLVEELTKQSGVVDLSLWISWFAYDFMGDMAWVLVLIDSSTISPTFYHSKQLRRWECYDVEWRWR